ncbi:MAG: acetylglutamate kinase [Bacteroidota bacterium]|jgi:acetylglutamate kinase
MAESAVTIIKLGGNILDDAPQRRAALENVARVRGSRILVHGGGIAATALAERLGIVPRMVEGRRITDDAMLEIVTMVYGGLVNRSVVAELQSLGCNACGFTGADLDLIRARRRTVEEIDYGHVGDIDAVNIPALLALFDQGATPVLAPLTHDGAGGLLNTNADTIASAVAAALSTSMHVSLLYVFDRGGVQDRNGNTLPSINPSDATELIANGIVSKGMLPKLHNAFEAAGAGAARVILCGAADIIATAEGGQGRWTEVRL